MADAAPQSDNPDEVQRRISTRDAELTARMVATLASVIALYVAVVGGTVWAAVALGRWSPVLIVPVGVIAAMTVIHFRSATALALRAVAGEIVDEAAEPELHRMVAAFRR
jgi:fatty acid desaturase